MPRMFRVPAGTDYPASLADYRIAKAGKPHHRAGMREVTSVIPAPYEEVIGSWLANGVEEVKDHGIPER